MPTIQPQEVQTLLQQHFGGAPGFKQEQAQTVAHTVAAAVQALNQHSGAQAVASPTQSQQQCYLKCQQDRDAALAKAATLGWPLGVPAAGAAEFRPLARLSSRSTHAATSATRVKVTAETPVIAGQQCTRPSFERA